MFKEVGTKILGIELLNVERARGSEMKGKTPTRIILVVLALSILICLPGTGYPADVPQLSPTQQTREPIQTIQPKSLDSTPVVQTTVPVVQSVAPEYPSLTAGGKPLTVTLAGSNLNLITSVQVIQSGQVVSNVTASLGTSAANSRQVTLTAQNGAFPGEYQIRLLAGEKTVDLNTTLVSVIVGGSPVQTPSSGVIAGKTTQGFSPATDILTERSGASTDRSAVKLPDSKPSDTVMIDTVPLPEKPATAEPGSRLPDSNKVDTLKIDTVPLPEKPIPELRRAKPQVPATDQVEMQPLRAPIPQTDTSGTRQLAISPAEESVRHLDIKEGLQKVPTRKPNTLQKEQEPSSASNLIGQEQFTEPNPLPSGTAAKPKPLSKSVAILPKGVAMEGTKAAFIEQMNRPDLAIRDCTFIRRTPKYDPEATGIQEFRYDEVNFTSFDLDADYEISLTAYLVNRGNTGATFPEESCVVGHQSDESTHMYTMVQVDVGGFYIGPGERMFLKDVNPAFYRNLTYWEETPGDHWFEFTADPNDIVNEIYETNNALKCSYSTYYGSGGPPPPTPRADIVITDATIRPSEGPPEGEYRMTVTVKNQGSAEGSVQVYCERFGFGNPGEPLSGGESRQFDLRDTITNLPPGQHSFRCTLSSYGQFDFDETENYPSATVLIRE